MDTTTTTPPAPTATSSRRRLRWVDAVRAGALAVVVIGHYLMAVVTVDADGRASVTGLLDTAPWAHPVTWVLQVMPVFFAVGAVAVAPRLVEAGGAQQWRAFMAPRVRRLVIPVVPLLTLWWAVGPWLVATFGEQLARRAAQAALVPLWFLATYLVVQALLPSTVRLVQAQGPLPLLGGRLVAIGLVDVAHHGGVPWIGWINFVLVWSLPSVLGAAHALGRLAPRILPSLVAVGLTAGVALVTWFGYAVPLVGAQAAGHANTFPPSLLLGLHATTYPALVLWLAPRAERWLGATAARRGVLARAGRWSMGVYLWHMTGLVVLLAVAIALPVPILDGLLAMEPLTVTWWLARLPFVAAALTVTVGLLVPAAQVTGVLLRWSARRPVPDVVGTAAATAAGSAAIAVTVVGGGAAASVLAVALLVGSLVVLHPALPADR